jgi:hypothetical protein
LSLEEDVEQKRARQRWSFTVEFKAEIVELCQRGDRRFVRSRVISI